MGTCYNSSYVTGEASNASIDIEADEEHGEDAEVTFKYKPGAMLYAYCNKHGLWVTEVE